MNFSAERKLSLPENVSQRLVENIQTYSALVEMQSKMTGPVSWYQKLN